MSADLENLDIIYHKLYEVSIQIGQLIDRKLYNELITFMNKKDQLLNEAGVLIEKIKESNENAEVLTEICTKIHEQEMANIAALTGVRDIIKKELNKTTTDKKILNAYSNAELKQGNLLDFRQ
jgi:hypothetical protein